jgi:hypothetical protein
MKGDKLREMCFLWCIEIDGVTDDDDDDATFDGEEVKNLIVQQCVFNCRPVTAPVYPRKYGKDLGRLPLSSEEFVEQMDKCQVCKDVKRSSRCDHVLCNAHACGAMFVKRSMGMIDSAGMCYYALKP